MRNVVYLKCLHSKFVKYFPELFKLWSQKIVNPLKFFGTVLTCRYALFQNLCLRNQKLVSSTRLSTFLSSPNCPIFWKIFASSVIKIACIVVDLL